MAQYHGISAKERLQRAQLWLKVMNVAGCTSGLLDLAMRINGTYSFEDIPLDCDQVMGLLNETRDISAFLQGVIKTLESFESYEQR